MAANIVRETYPSATAQCPCSSNNNPSNSVVHCVQFVSQLTSTPQQDSQNDKLRQEQQTTTTNSTDPENNDTNTNKTHPTELIAQQAPTNQRLSTSNHSPIEHFLHRTSPTLNGSKHHIQKLQQPLLVDNQKRQQSPTQQTTLQTTCAANHHPSQPLPSNDHK